MRKEYKYSNLKQETTTSGKVMLEPSKKIKKRKPGVKPPKTSLRDLFIQFMNKQEQFNKRQEEFNKRQEEFNKTVTDTFKRNNLK